MPAVAVAVAVWCAGEGAFGAVYVGKWRNMVVAVKIIKDNSGSRSLKTAWELAVNKSLSHPCIVTVRNTHIGAGVRAGAWVIGMYGRLLPPLQTESGEA